MKKITFKETLLLLAALCNVMLLQAQTAFTNSNSNFTNSNYYSGCAMAVTDWNNDGLDDVVRLSNGHDVYVEIQTTNHQFTNLFVGSFGSSHAWAMAVADVDHNGYKDILCDNGGVKIMRTNAMGMMSIQTFPNSGYLLQNSTFCDIDNDGWADVFCCDDNAAAHIYMNDGTGILNAVNTSTDLLTIPASFPTTVNLTSTGGTFTAGQTLKIGYNGLNYMTGTVTSYNSGTGALVMSIASAVGSGSHNSWSVHPSVVMNFNYHYPAVHGSDPDDSGNYGSAWTDFDNDGDLDLYIPHCRQSVPNDSTDVRRQNRLFVNDGNGNYTEQSAVYGISCGRMSWTSSFADIDNDGDLDLLLSNVINGSSPASQIFLNDGTGHYSDITSSAGLVNTLSYVQQGVGEDFDNDGFVDFLCAGQGGFQIYHNNGNNTFTAMSGMFVPTGGTMLSFAIGDLNHDGFIDVMAGYGSLYNTPSTTNPDIYWRNNTNPNHFITFNLEGAGAGFANKNAIGARVTIYGTWGKQIREVRAGESYGTINSSQLHFGLGTATVVDSAVISWPSHHSQTIINPHADQFVKVIENSCVSPNANVSASGSLNICVGQTLTLTAPAGSGYSYLWSDGTTTSQTLGVTAAGDYNVMVSATGNSCSSVSQTISVTLNAESAPSITPLGLTEFCQGGSVVLSLPVGPAYTWSTTDTTHTLTVTQSGSYSVSVAGACSGLFSAPVNVVVHYPAAPVVPSVTIPGPGTATFTATSGTGINWFDVPTGGASLGTGSSFTTPVVNSTTEFYSEASESFGGGLGRMGLMYPQNAFGGTNINAKMYFSVTQNCTLKSVKVYTDVAGTRKIELRDAGHALLNSTVINVSPDSQVVTLNYPLVPGTNYTLGTDSMTNQAMAGWGNYSPEFKRNSLGVTYPYSVTGFASITNSSYGGSYFYYFYDWQIEKPQTVCPGPRGIDTVFVTSPLGISEIATSNFNVFPNPTNGILNAVIDAAMDEAMTLYVTDVVGKEIMTKSINVNSGRNVVAIDITGNPAGFYFIRLAGKSGSVTVKSTLIK